MPSEFTHRAEFLRSVLDQLPVLVWVTDTELRVTEQVGAAPIDGLTPIGTTLYDHWGDGDPVGAISNHVRALAGETVTAEAEHETRWLSYRLQALRRGGAVVGVAGIGLDVTEQRSLQRAIHHAQRVDTIGKLTGGIAHDFNNMLVAILGNLDLARTNPAGLDRYLTNARTATERSADLVRKLLAYARNQVLEPERVDVNEEIRRNVEVFRPVLGETVLLALDLADDAGATSIDVTQFEQVLLNLAVNARDAMSPGGTLTFATRLREADEGLPPGRWVEVSVSDTGPGIPHDVVSQIFDPFFTTKPEGTGLGLSTVSGIVAQSGGHIAVDSEPGGGTTFRLLLRSVD